MVTRAFSAPAIVVERNASVTREARPLAFVIPRQHRVHRRFARAGIGPSRRRRQLPWVLGLCLFGILAFGSVAASVGLVWGLVWFGQFAGALPPPENLTAHQPFQTTRVVASDRGTLLYEITDPEGGRRTVVTLDQVPRYLIEATIATEDAGFFSNPGLEPRSILRAGLDDLSHNGIVSGASTITQQVVRNVLLTPEERQQVSAARKIREIIVAYQLTQTYTKEQILQIYLNEINYGNHSYGIEAASVAYFGKSAVSLDLAECALLTGLPQAPSYFDPYVRPDEVKQRQLYVLQRMVEQGYLTQDEADAAGGETLTFIDSRHAQVAPHFVAYVSDLLDRQLGIDQLYHGGDTAITTLDPQLQASAERAVNQNLDALHQAGGNNTAVVALDPQTGHVLAMVGSASFDDSQIAGEVNMTLAEHQSGGVLSPLTYAVALQKGKTLIDQFEIRQNGPVTVAAPAPATGAATDPQVVRLTLRDALGRDLAAPAIQLMGTVGNQSFLDLGTRIGLANFSQRVDYGVNQTIAGAHVTPLEVARVYATLAGAGVSRLPITIERIVDPTGTVLFQADTSGQDALDPGVAYLVSTVLADPAMRPPEILPGGTGEQPVATRLSLAEDLKDAWAVGYTPNLVVVVWTGNSNGRALTDAGPAARILNDLVLSLIHI